jgi:hypothetical protein
VKHDWRVSRLAVPYAGVCTCPLRSCVDPHLMLRPPIVLTNTKDVETAWAKHPWNIALIANHFEVFEVPPHIGAPLHRLLGDNCPTAFLPASHRWQFFLAAGSVSAAKASSAGGELFNSWVPAPGTRTEAAGKIRWLVPPYAAHWKPHVRQDAIDLVLA